MHLNAPDHVANAVRALRRGDCDAPPLVSRLSAALALVIAAASRASLSPSVPCRRRRRNGSSSPTLYTHWRATTTLPTTSTERMISSPPSLATLRRRQAKMHSALPLGGHIDWTSLPLRRPLASTLGARTRRQSHVACFAPAPPPFWACAKVHARQADGAQRRADPPVAPPDRAMGPVPQERVPHPHLVVFHTRLRQVSFEKIAFRFTFVVSLGEQISCYRRR